MAIEPGQTHQLSLPGEVVEIFEKEGNCLTKIALRHSNLLDITAENLQDAHLGDRVIIEAKITIDRIRSQDLNDHLEPDFGKQIGQTRE
jgi:hypothetical protein